MKKLCVIKALMLVLMPFVMLSFTQCKKKLETITTSGEKVYITLNVGNGSRHDVNTATGQVTYTEGDVIYVGNAGKFIGTLTCSKVGDNCVFSGDITDPQTTDYLHFYFVGGLTPDNIVPNELLPTAGETTSFDVDISDQSSKLPVLSYVHTVEYYEGGTTYNCMLENKCGLVKFTLTNGTSETVKIAGMKTGVTINFADTHKPIVANGKRDAITLNSENDTEKWAILLPQDAYSDRLALINGVAYDCAVAAVANNDYITTNIIDNTTPSTEKLFTVSKNGNVVRFSLGNLQYNQTTQQYSFMEHQYDRAEALEQNVGVNYANQNIVSLFSWGLADNPTTTTEDLSYYGTFKDWGDYCGDPTGHSYHWYTLSKDEWIWLLGERSYADPGVNCRDGIRHLNANITVGTSVYDGVIIFPDGYDGSIGSYSYNNQWNRVNVSADDWSLMESAGAVFLPAAYRRTGEVLPRVNAGCGYYWSSTDAGYNKSYTLSFDDGFAYGVSPNASPSCFLGQSVRLVR